jgi:peroxiredoxin family protein
LENNRATIILFSDALDKVLAAFTIAITSASMGLDTTIFFTFWGLNVIKKEKGKIETKGILRKMLNLINRGGVSRLRISKFNMGGIGTKMMKTLMKDIKMQDLDEMIKTAKQLGIKFVACTTSIGVMGLPKDAFIPEVDEFAGAATYIGIAKESKINLFI